MKNMYFVVFLHFHKKITDMQQKVTIKKLAHNKNILVYKLVSIIMKPENNVNSYHGFVLSFLVQIAETSLSSDKSN